MTQSAPWKKRSAPALDLPATRENLERLKKLRALYAAEESRRANVEAGSPQHFSRYATDPAGFIIEALQEHPWSRQRQIAEAVRDHRRVAVPSAHGMGKSFVASRIVAWWLSCHPSGEAFAVTTAPTFQQVRGILWREIGRAHAKGNLPGRTNQTEWLIGNELVAFGRKPADMDMAAFQGIHARYVLVVIDEAGGVPHLLWEAADTLITNDDSRILAIGNPDDPTGHFAHVCKPGSGWQVFPISVFDSPNFTGEAVPDSIRPLLTGKTWVEEKRRDWGEESPLWQAKILGQFPEMGDDTLIPARWLREAAMRHGDAADGDPVELGVDVSRFGSDETVLYLRRGNRAHLHGTARKRDLMTACGLIVQAIKETGATAVKIDDIGLGGGVTDRLNEIVKEERAKPPNRPGQPQQRNETLARVKIYGVNVGQATSTKTQAETYLNLRAELYFSLRSRFQDGTISIPDDDITISQLGATKYEIDSRGRIKIESKDDMKKRGLPSPDRADALMLCFADCSLFEPPAWVTTPVATPQIPIFRMR
jgi:hypothetical protein